MLERLKICWYVLTKKHYAFFAYNSENQLHRGTACFVDEQGSKSKVFLGAISDFCDELAEQ